MPELAKRDHSMPPSPIRKLVPYAEAAKKMGVKVYHINIGQPDIPSPDEFMNAFKNHNLNVLEYGHSVGLWE